MLSALDQRVRLIDSLADFLPVAEYGQDRTRMRLTDIDNEEFDFVLVVLVNPLQVARLATKRRSGIAAEDENDRLLAPEARKLDIVLTRSQRQHEVRGLLTGQQLYFVSLTLRRRGILFLGTRW
jgi:hypothetical protein